MVAVQWTAVETMVTAYVHGLTDKDEPARLEFDKTWSFAPRLDQWQHLTENRVLAPWRATMLNLINDVRQTQELRDKIVHGTLGDKENATEINREEAHGVFNWTKPNPPFKWKLTYGEILQVARRIDNLHYAMFDFLLDASGKKDSQEFFMLTDALQRISRKPDHPS